MFNVGDRVKVVNENAYDFNLGELGTITEVFDTHVLVAVDGYEPTDFDLLMAVLTGVTSGSVPFAKEEVANA